MTEEIKNEELNRKDTTEIVLSGEEKQISAPLLDENSDEYIKIQKEKKKNSLIAFICSIVGLLFGLGGEIPCVPFLGIILSIVAFVFTRKFIKKFGNLEGLSKPAKWISIAGICVNTIGIIINIIYAVIVLFELIVAAVIFIIGVLFVIIDVIIAIIGGVYFFGDIVISLRDILQFIEEIIMMFQ